MESHGGVLWYSVKLWYSYVCQPTKKRLPICVYPMRRKNGIPGVWSMKVGFGFCIISKCLDGLCYCGELA